MVSKYHKSFNKDCYDNVCDMCRKASIGCIACKKELYNKLNATLDPVRERRAYYENHKNTVRELIFAGTEKANRIGDETMKKVKQAMHLKV